MQFFAQFTPQDYREFTSFMTFAKGGTGNRRARRKPIATMVGFMVASGLLFVLLRALLAWGGSVVVSALDVLLEIVSWLLGLLFFVYLVMLLNIQATFKRHAANLARFTPDSNFWINEQGITTHSADGEVQHFFGWSRVDQVLLTDNLYIFVTAGGIAVLLPKRAVGAFALQLDYLIAASMAGKPIKQL